MRLKKLIGLGLSLVMVNSVAAGCGGTATGAATVGGQVTSEAAAEPAWRTVRKR